MLKILLLLFVFTFNLSAYSMTCMSLLSTSKSIDSLESPLNSKDFDMAQAILEEAMFSHGISFNSFNADEFLPDRENGVIFMNNYTLTLSNQRQFVIQFKYILRKPSQNYYFVINIIDVDSSMMIFEEDRYNFLTSFMDPDMRPDRNHPNFDENALKGFSLGHFNLQIVDENDNESFVKDQPRFVEIVFVDPFENDLALINFQQTLRVLMSNFSQQKPEL